MSTAEYRETAPPISRLGTGADTAPGAFLLLSAYPRRCRMLASPMSTQTALCTILSMMASACTPPPSLGCQSFFLSCVQKTVEAVPYHSSISSSSIDLNYVFGLSSSHSPPRGHQYVLDAVLRDAGGAGDRVLRQTVHRPQPQDSLVLSFSPFGTSSFSGLHGSPSVTGMAGDVYWRCRTAIFGWVDGGADAQYRWCRKGLGLSPNVLIWRFGFEKRPVCYW